MTSQGSSINTMTRKRKASGSRRNSEENIEPQTEETSYCEDINNLSNGTFITISQLKAMATSKGSIYGVVKMVTGVGAHHKEVTVYDVSDETGIEVSISCRDRICTGNVIRFRNISRKHGVKYSCLEAGSDFHQIASFAYDYDLADGIQGGFELKYFTEPQDKPIAHLIEKWISRRLFASSFSNLKYPDEGHKYIDFVAQVLTQRKMKQSVVLTLWDGSRPSLPAKDPFIPQVPSKLEYVCRLNEAYYPFAVSRYVHMNVWGNESNTDCDHHLISSSLRLVNGDDLLAFFNVEVDQTRDSGELLLTMRSGRHYGKSVRVINRTSLLGKLLMKRIDGQVRQVKIKLGIEEATAETRDEQPLKEAASSQATTCLPSMSSSDFRVIAQERTSTPLPVQETVPTVAADQEPSTPKATTTIIPVSEEEEMEEDLKELVQRLPAHVSIDLMKNMSDTELKRYRFIVEADCEENPYQNITKEGLLRLLDYLLKNKFYRNTQS